MQQFLRSVAHLLAALMCATVAHAAPYPDELSGYGVLLRDGNTLRPQGNTVVYGLASPLFTDYALKFRTITLPAGAEVGYRSDGVLNFPPGTVISKTFYYARDPKHPAGWLKTRAVLAGESIDLTRYQLVETRILARQSDGNWLANTYIWDEAQTTARLQRIGKVLPGKLRDEVSGTTQTFDYGVPNARQCQTCHAVNATVGQSGIEPIGPKAAHLNLEYGYDDGAMNQLRRFARIARLQDFPADVRDIPTTPAYANATAHSVEVRARAYMDINCAHCHHAMGDARQSGLFLTPQAQGSHVGICKQHVAAGSGGANLTYDIVPGRPDQSLLTLRMEATSGQAMMPRVGRSLVDVEGVQLLGQWIAALPGNCATER